MKITQSIKTNVIRTLAVVALAGAMFTAAAPKAEAQRFFVGARIGGPVFVPPVRIYAGPAYPAPVYGYGSGYGYAPGYYGYRHDYRFHHGYYGRGWR